MFVHPTTVHLPAPVISHGCTGTKLALSTGDKRLLNLLLLPQKCNLGAARGNGS